MDKYSVRDSNEKIKSPFKSTILDTDAIEKNPPTITRLLKEKTPESWGTDEVIIGSWVLGGALAATAQTQK